MKIYDCFLYCNEDLILDLRFNILDQFVDRFVVSESKYYHNGQIKGFNFDIDKYPKFKKKIDYLPIDKPPANLYPLTSNNKKNEHAKIMNAIKFENYQRNHIFNGLLDCDKEDLIILSDIDEIPNLEQINLNSIKNEVVFFNQKYFYYKLNLYNPNQNWYGSRIIKFKNLQSLQWLRNLKTKKNSIWRLDKFFNNKVYHDMKVVENGGWHFSYINDPKGILNKLNTYMHHVDFEKSLLSTQDVKQYIKNKKPIYDLSCDQRENKFKSNSSLKKIDDSELPKYILNNKEKLKEWLI